MKNLIQKKKQRFPGSSLSDQEKKYIEDQLGKQSVNKIRNHLGCTFKAVKAHLKSKGIKFETNQDWRKKVSGFYFSAKHKKYLKENSMRFSINHLAKHIGSSFPTVKRYLVKNNLPFKLHKTRRTKEEIEVDKQIIVKPRVINRPPAQYSNRDYSSIYL